MVKVLVACEYSGRVRDAFIKNGHDAISCDLLPSDSPGPHYQEDVRNIRLNQFDMLISFPPCTYICCSGTRWHSGTAKQKEALEFIRFLMDTDVPRIAIENPVGVISTHIRKPDQIIQPWQFGHGETKATCLWLKNLPKLIPTDIVSGRIPRIHRMSPSTNRAKLRSLTYQGIANAMADQWGGENT